MLKTILSVAAAGVVTAGAAAAQGDAAAGERVFRKCAACHMVGDDAKNRVGPVLNGVIGREIASVDGFRYSDAFTDLKAEGFVWTEENLHAYLENPRQFIKRNRMAFAGLRKADERADVIAYLAKFQ